MLRSHLDRLLKGEFRALLVVAHPDDETIGAGALLARLPDVRVLHITDGAPRDPQFFLGGFAGSCEEYAAVRRQELAAAMALAGIGPERLLRVEGIADQEAALALPRIAREVVRLCRELRPEILLTHTYEGGHPDHDAAAFACRAAVELLRSQGEEPPGIVEMPFYHARPGDTRSENMVIQELLPAPDEAATRRVDLTPAERELKERMAACFATQLGVVELFLPAVQETFREAPAWDFTRPPHVGLLLYELWGFPITGERWRELARAALGELGIGDVSS